MENKRHILEVGPGITPMHHRHGDDLQRLPPDKRSLKLGEGEHYTALEVNAAVFRTRFWQTIQREHEARVNLVTGDGEEMTQFEAHHFDEVTALGTRCSEKLFSECSRVLKPGGTLNIGLVKKSAKYFNHQYLPTLLSLGFRSSGDQTYRYTSGRGFVRQLMGADYLVLSFEKSLD